MINFLTCNPNAARVGESTRLLPAVVFEDAASGTRQLYFEVKSEYGQSLCFATRDVMHL